MQPVIPDGTGVFRATAVAGSPDAPVTVYITENPDGSYSFAQTGDEGNARTVTAAKLAAWQIVAKAWEQDQAELAEVYRSSGF